MAGSLFPEQPKFALLIVSVEFSGDKEEWTMTSLEDFHTRTGSGAGCGSGYIRKSCERSFMCGNPKFLRNDMTSPPPAPFFFSSFLNRDRGTLPCPWVCPMVVVIVSDCE